jgi:hypothetical protein
MINKVSGSPVIQTVYRYIAWWSVEQERKKAFQIRKCFTETETRDDIFEDYPIVFTAVMFNRTFWTDYIIPDHGFLWHLRDWALCRIQIKTRDFLKRKKFWVRKNKKVSKHSTLKLQEKPLERTHSSFTKNFFYRPFSCSWIQSRIRKFSDQI